MAARPLASARWYATEPEAKKDDEAAAAEGKVEEKSEDPVKKELEAKDREIIDLKVCVTPSPPSSLEKYSLT